MSNNNDSTNKVVAMPVEPKGITPCVTIDHTRNDNGFLACAAVGNPGAMNHRSTNGAVANLIKALGTAKKSAHIIGHGDSGIIVTGTGQLANDPDKFIGLDNQTNWQPYVKHLKDKVAGLALWACHPGAGVKGANFLYNVAKVINAKVSGPTGFLYCNNGKLTLEAGSTWQHATPMTKPSPINAPTPYLHLQSMQLIRLNINNTQLEFNYDKVTKVAIISYTRNNSRNDLSRKDVETVLNLIDFANPVQLPGIPAAIATGELLITLDNNGQELVKRFYVYNNRLIQDTDAALTGYYCSEKVEDFIG